MTLKVWTEVALHPFAIERLRSAVDLTEAGKRDSLPGSEVAIIGSSRVDGEFLDAAGPGLKMVVRHGIGYDKVNVPAASERRILVANTPEGPTEGTAEHAVGLMLAVAKGIARSDRVLHADGNWAASKYRGIELVAKTLGLVGFGRIGRRVGEICALGLGMKVAFFDPYTGPTSGLDFLADRLESIEQLLGRADVVSLHLGLSSDTRHLLNKQALGLMKGDAILINTSRGEIVDEVALIEVLRDKRLRGAGIDVFDPEPPRADNPLLGLPNTVVTAHLASATDELSFRSSSGVVDQILQLQRGEQPTWLVDPAAWAGRRK